MFANIEQQRKAIQAIGFDQRIKVEAYIETGSPTKAIRKLGLKCGAKTFSQSVRDSIKKIGCKSLSDLIVEGKEGLSKSNSRAAQLMRLIESQEYKCALTGDPLTPDEAELDHIVPIQSGGTNEISNLQWVSRNANRAKGTMSQGKFIEMCVKVAAIHGATPPGAKTIF